MAVEAAMCNHDCCKQAWPSWQYTDKTNTENRLSRLCQQTKTHTLQQYQHNCHLPSAGPYLGEDEHSVASFLEPSEQLVQQHHLATGHRQALYCTLVCLTAAIALLSTLKEEGVVAALLELVDDVEQRDMTTTSSACVQYMHSGVSMQVGPAWSLMQSSQQLLQLSQIQDAVLHQAWLTLVKFLEVPGQDPAVVLLLKRSHLHTQNALVLGWQTLLHVLDHTAQ